MAAKIYFNGWRKPTEAEILSLWQDEGSFGLVVFEGDSLHQFIREPFLLQEANAGRIAAEKLRGERIHLKIPNRWHAAFSRLRMGGQTVSNFSKPLKYSAGFGVRLLAPDLELTESSPAQAQSNLKQARENLEREMVQSALRLATAPSDCSSRIKFDMFHLDAQSNGPMGLKRADGSDSHFQQMANLRNAQTSILNPSAGFPSAYIRSHPRLNFSPPFCQIRKSAPSDPDLRAQTKPTIQNVFNFQQPPASALKLVKEFHFFHVLSHPFHQRKSFAINMLCIKCRLSFMKFHVNTRGEGGGRVFGQHTGRDQYL